MGSPNTTILIPHYKTLELTKLCLRLLRLYTDPNQARVLVIDNGSQDESTAYLKQVSWIQLLVRDTKQDNNPWESHGNALDEALAHIDTPYVISFHTDTMVKHKQWLNFLLQHIEGKPQVAGVGSWKLESKPWPKRLAKAIERYYQLGFYRLIGKKDHKIYGVDNKHYYLRSHCALYRTALLKSHHLKFVTGNSTVGKGMHQALEKLGYDMLFLPSETLGQYMDHLNHATMVLHPVEMKMASKEVRKGLKRIRKGLKQLNADAILADDSLDH